MSVLNDIAKGGTQAAADPASSPNGGINPATGLPWDFFSSKNSNHGPGGPLGHGESHVETDANGINWIVFEDGFRMQEGDHTGILGGAFDPATNWLADNAIPISGDNSDRKVITAFNQVEHNYPDRAASTLQGMAGPAPSTGTQAPVNGPPTIGAIGDGGGGGSGGGGVGPLEGLDMTKPGALEQYQKETGDYFKQPTMSEMFAQGAINKGAGPGVSNRADEAYQSFNGSSPANMDPYYANERRKAEENINRATAARGVYGSSAANDMIGEAFTNLGADQAKAEAQYGLQRGSLLGSLAQGADSSSATASRDRLGWTSALSSIANGADASGLSRVVSGANVAGAAQGAQRNRGQDAINNQFAIGDRESGIMGHGYDNIFGADMGLLKDIVGLNTGTGTEGYNQASGDAARARSDVSNTNNLLGNNTTYAKGVTDLFKPDSNPTPAPSPLPQQQQPAYYGPQASQNYGTTNWYDPNRP